MERQYEKKITWTIKNFSSLQPKKIYSDQFIFGGCKWRLIAYPKGNGIGGANCFSMFLSVADSESLPSGWRRHAKFRLTVLNQLPKELSIVRETHKWFDQKLNAWGFAKMLTLAKLYDKDGGFLVNNEVKIVVEVDVLEVIGKSDVLEETTYEVKTINLYGFQLLPIQVESVRLIFERHPDIAVDFCAKNQLLRNACMNFLLSVIDTLCQSIQDLSSEDLVEADIALTYLKDARFKVDWLEKKLEQVKEKKEKEHFESVIVKLTKDDLLKQRQKCSEMEEQVKKEEAELLATRSPLAFDDVV